jgi:hypothetical protein
MESSFAASSVQRGRNVFGPILAAASFIRNENSRTAANAGRYSAILTSVRALRRKLAKRQPSGTNINRQKY